jgi:hypothetical protein
MIKYLVLIVSISLSTISMEIKKAIAQHDYKKVHSQLQTLATAPVAGNAGTPATNSPALLSELLEAAQGAEGEALQATGTAGRVGRIIGGAALIVYAGANIALSYTYALKCQDNTGTQATSAVLNSSSLLGPLAGGAYLIYSGIANRSVTTQQTNAGVITKMIKGHYTEAQANA